MMIYAGFIDMTKQIYELLNYEVQTEGDPHSNKNTTDTKLVLDVKKGVIHIYIYLVGNIFRRVCVSVELSQSGLECKSFSFT